MPYSECRFCVAWWVYGFRGSLTCSLLPPRYTPQGMYYYPTEPALQYPYLQYQYSVPTYTPGGAQDGGIEPAMLYAMPMLSAGMMT